MISILSALLLAATVHGTPAKPHYRMTFRTTEFAFTGPRKIDAGVTTFVLKNAGKQVHHIQVVKLEEGHTLKEFTDGMKNPGPPPRWVVQVGGPNAVVPGGTAEATMDLEAGNYALLCFVPSPGEQIPHMAKGMVRELTVGPRKSRATEREPDIEIRLTDYAFTESAPLTKGVHTIRVTNEAAQQHELTLFQLAPGRTGMDVGHWAESGMKGPPPGRPVGGITGLNQGKSATFTMRLTPGTYAMVCFFPDAGDGKPHFVHGMVKEFTIAAK